MLQTHPACTRRLRRLSAWLAVGFRVQRESARREGRARGLQEPLGRDFGEAQGACRAYASWFHAAGCQQIGHFLPKLAVTIQNHVAVSTSARKCLPQLLHYPGAGRVFRDIEMKDPASTVFDHKETIQDSESEGRHGEEVHGHDDIAVIAQERSPELAGLLAGIQAAEIPRNSAFTDIESELQKLTVNPRSAPACILLYHPSDEGSNFSIDSWPAEILGA